MMSLIHKYFYFSSIEFLCCIEKRAMSNWKKGVLCKVICEMH